MKNKKGSSFKWVLLPILFSSAAVLAGSDQVSALTPDDPCVECPAVSDGFAAMAPSPSPSAADQADTLAGESDGFLDDAQEVSTGNLNFVGGNTRLGVGIDTEFKGRADLSHVFSETDNSVTSGQGWVGVNPSADSDLGEEVLTGAGVKLNHHWLATDENGQPAYVNKVFGAYDQNEAKDKKVTFGYGQERENLFWSGHLSKGLSDKRVSGQAVDGQAIYEKAYDFGVGGRVGAFMDDQLLRVQGGLDYEWGTDVAASEDTASQLTVSGGVEKFFPDSPHSVGANIEVLKEQGGYAGDKHEADVRGNVNYRYEFGGDGLFQSDEKYRRVRVEIPGKTTVTKKPRAPKVERKLVKHTMELESDTFFQVGKHMLTPDAQQRLMSVVARLRDSGHEGNIRITGNTCDRGTDAYNQALSERRAGAVRNFLAANGFNPGELQARGLGETQPKYPNTEESRHRNRRVDIEYVTYQTKYKDEVINQGEEEIRTTTPGQIVWRKELIPTMPTWVGQALRNNIQYKQTIDTYRTLGADGNGTVDPGNSAPVAVDDTGITTTVDTSVSFDVLANDSDPEGDALSIIRFDQNSTNGGTVTLADGLFTYVPAAGFSGTDTFTYTISDGNGGEATATVTITVTAEGGNNQPVAGDDTKETTANTPVTIDVLGNDTDPDGDILKILDYNPASAQGGTVIWQNGQLVYTPADGFTGTDTFNYTVTDSNGGEATATVTITVLEGTGGGGNTAPTAVNDSKTTTIDTAVTLDVLANDTDPEGDVLAILGHADVSTEGGAITLVDGQLVYTPASGFTGTDTFDYTITDGNGGESTATVTITVVDGGGDDGMKPDDDSFTVSSGDLDGDGKLGLNVLEGDVYSGEVTIRIITHPSKGTIRNAAANGDVADGLVSYAPTAGATGTDSFVYVLVDSAGNVSEQATVTIQLPNGSGGGKLELEDDTHNAVSGNVVPVTLDVLGNDSGDGMTIIEIVSQPRFGSAAIDKDGQTIVYTLRSGYCEDHSFTYKVRDQYGNEAVATVYINIID